MKVVTAKEIHEIDRLAIEEYGIPGIALMENAGAAVAREIIEHFGHVSNKKVCVFCGKGNNGGDGFVVARHLYNHGAKVKVFLLAGKTGIAQDAAVNMAILEKMGLDIMEVSGERDWDKVHLAVTFADCLIDAMVGTGFKGQLTGTMARVAETLNRSGKRIFAVDIPSGLDGDTGQITGVAVQASCTVTFSLAKQGVLLYPGAAYVGDLRIVDIGIPYPMLADEKIKQNLICTKAVKELLSRREPDAHKGSNGSALVIAGSKGFSGAAALASLAVLKAGAGIAMLGVPESLHDIMEVKVTEVITKPLPESAEGSLALEALADIQELSEGVKVVALGPGLGRHAGTMDLVRQSITRFEKPMVLDADALYALVGHTDLLGKAKALPVLTPHPGEMARLVGLTSQEVNEDRVYIARQAAIEWQCIVVLKGAPTVISFPDGEVYINTSGNEGMGTAGTGDVLTGTITGLIAQGMSSHAAALAGVYLHGLAGDIAAQNGKIGLTASELLNALPAARTGIEAVEE